MMADDSSDNAFSFVGHAAAPAAGTQSNSSQSIDTGGSDNSELRTQVPRRALLLQEGDSLQFRASRTQTIHPENEDHLTGDRHLRGLQGPRRSLHPRIRLYRFRTHRGSDHTRRYLLHQVVAISSLPIRMN